MSIQVEHLTKVYDGQKAVNDISFSIQKGEIVGFLGPNGAGKSTTMKIITGYLPATAGTVSVCGLNATHSSLEVRRRIGYLPESNPLYGDMYVKEYLHFMAGVHGLGMAAIARIDEMIRLTGLTPEKHKKIGSLSKGYKQRVGLAQALLHDPEILILDEPTSGLDPNQLVEIRELIRQAGQNKTVILSTHIMQEVQAMCNRVIIIHKGKIVADDTLHALQGHHQNPPIVVKFNEPVATTLLASLPGVEAATSSDQRNWVLTTRENETVCKNLLQFALQNNLNILSLQSNSSTLEEVFRELTNH